MGETIESMREEIARDRAQVGATVTELRDTVHAKAAKATSTVDPRRYARDYPWIALGLVIGAGYAIGRSGADRAAAAGALEGAKKAGGAIGDGAVSLKDSVVERFTGGNEAEPAVPADQPVAGVRARVMGAVQELLQQGLDEVLGDLGVNARPRSGT